jgi:NAD(P)-dependent dehydrogenase (short-subunit alcohol dehydrogenase family)
MKVQLKDQVALVTGAAGAIGQAICASLAANGAKVVYADINLEGARQLAAATPGAMALRMDVTDENQIESAIGEIIAAHGRLDILVNNAGINTMAHRVNIDSFPAEEWDRILRVDLTGLFLVSKAASRHMLQHKSGRIINISSVMGLVPARLQCAYTAAKAGVVNLTRTMAIELGSQGILTNCIAPGSILSEGTKRLFYGENGQFNDRVQAMLSHVPLGRPGQPEEIAHAVLFLAAPLPRRPRKLLPQRRHHPRRWRLASGLLPRFLKPHHTRIREMNMLNIKPTLTAVSKSACQVVR